MLFNRGNAISGAPIINGQTNSQNHQSMLHYKKENHNNACAVTMYYIVDSLI